MWPSRKSSNPSTPRGLICPPIFPRRRSTAKPIRPTRPILTLALSSNTLPLSKVEDLADTRLAPKISQLPGVGLVSISGGQKPAVRIQANPSQLAAYGINMEDMRSAIIAANVNQAKGNFDGPRQSYQIGANDQLLSSSDYASLVVAYKNGAPVLMTKVADVVDSVEDIHEAAWMNEHARRDREYSTAARRQHHLGGGSHQEASSAAHLHAARCHPGKDPDGPHHHHPRIGERRRVRADADHRPGGDGDLSVSAETCRPPLSPASPCRCRWWGPSA